MPTELTQKDIELLQAELKHRQTVLRPKLMEAVKEARAFGDLSENFEYKAAKREKNRNDSRCRYLENLLKHGVVISDQSVDGRVGLYDKITLYLEEDKETITCQIVTRVRQDALNGLVSKDSPVGRAVLGKAVGDRVTVHVSDQYSYNVMVQDIQPGEDPGQTDLINL